MLIEKAASLDEMTGVPSVLRRTVIIIIKFSQGRHCLKMGVSADNVYLFTKVQLNKLSLSLLL